MSYETISIAAPDVRALWGFNRGSRFLVEINEANGREQRRSRYLNPRAVATANTEYLDQSHRQIYRDFILGRGGPLLPFYVFIWDPTYYKGFTFGVGDGSSYGFTIPFGNPIGPSLYPAGATSLAQAYVAGVARPATVQVGTGTYGEDKILFQTAAAAPVATPVGSGGSLGAGTYQFSYTYVGPTGESYDSGISATITTVASGSATLTGILPGPAGTTSRKLYRSKVGALGARYFDQTIGGNVTTTATSTQADGTLGVASPGVAPPVAGVLSADLTARARIGVRFTNNDQTESFVAQTALVLAVRQLDVIQVDQDVYVF